MSEWTVWKRSREEVKRAPGSLEDGRVKPLARNDDPLGSMPPYAQNGEHRQEYHL